MFTSSPLAVRAAAASTAVAHSKHFSAARRSLTTRPLTAEHTQEVLAFLAERPVHTVVMAGLIRDNGFVSHLNRGSFYGCRDAAGSLQGVALIGHVTLFETRTEAALAALARQAKACSPAHVVVGEAEKIERFWSCYAGWSSHTPRRASCELLFEQRYPIPVHGPAPSLRPATLADLPQVIAAHAEVVYQETGVNPLHLDATGFHKRCARRVEQNRVWVLMEDDRLIFKADVTAATPEATYLEGIYVDPAARGKGYGLRCLSHLSCTLLATTAAICLLVNERNDTARRLYTKVGFKLHSRYTAVFP